MKKLDNIINDKEKTKQLKESRRKKDEALMEIEKLKLQLAQAKDENKKTRIQNINNQSSIEKPFVCYKKAKEINPNDADA